MCLGCRSKSSGVKARSKCMHEYNRLVSLDLQVIATYEKIKDSRLLSINKLLREWIKNLRKECPSEVELEELLKILENEYSIS